MTPVKNIFKVVISRRIILLAVNDRTKSTLVEKITFKVEQGSILFTDCWKGYSELDTMSYYHRKVNHSLHFVDKETNVSIQHPEIVLIRP